MVQQSASKQCWIFVVPFSHLPPGTKQWHAGAALQVQQSNGATLDLVAKAQVRQFLTSELRESAFHFWRHVASLGNNRGRHIPALSLRARQTSFAAGPNSSPSRARACARQIASSYV